ELDILWLERETRVIEGVRFVGTTLWADFDALAEPADSLAEALKKRGKAMRAADFYLEKAATMRNGELFLAAQLRDQALA
ncbi:metallophosphoesterase, partial [Mycobacterium tuberculosis]